MNWDAIGAIGEMVGAVAVIITLVYLAVQVRQARQEVRRSTSRARSDARRSALAVMSDARVLPLYVKAQAAEGGQLAIFAEHATTHYGMTAEEGVLLAQTVLSAWQTRLQTIGVIDELGPFERREFEEELRFMYGRPGAERRMYELVLKPRQHPDVIRYVESVLGHAA